MPWSGSVASRPPVRLNMREDDPGHLLILTYDNEFTTETTKSTEGTKGTKYSSDRYNDIVSKTKFFWCPLWP
jgi:hypothetical protein